VDPREGDGALPSDRPDPPLEDGFGASLRAWVQQELQDVIQYLLGPRHVEARRRFDGATVKRSLDESAGRRADRSCPIDARRTLEPWARCFVDRPGAEVSL
jgi:hypothetical protein